MLPTMFIVSEEAATAIRTAYEQDGELSAAVELRRLFPGITDNAAARECARTIASWKPLPAAACRLPRYAFVGAGFGRRSPDRTCRPVRPGCVTDDGRFAQTHGHPSRWPLMTEDGKPLETLLEDAARARRLAIVLDGDPAALELE
jgi:hypothetical protein